MITASQTLVILDPAGGTCQWTALSWTEEKAWYTRFSISCNRLNLWSCKWLMWKMLFTLIYLTIWKFPGRCHNHRSHQKLTIGMFFQAWCTCQIRRPFSHFAVWSLLSVVKQVLARSSVVFLHAFVLGIFMCIHVYKSVFFLNGTPFNANWTVAVYDWFVKRGWVSIQRYFSMMFHVAILRWHEC